MPEVATKVLVTKRSGEVVDFNSELVKNAIVKAVIASGGQQIADETIDTIVKSVSEEVQERFTDDFLANVENIQDIVEKNLMKFQFFDVAKAYILYRAEKQNARDAQRKKKSYLKTLVVKKRDGRKVLFNYQKIKNSALRACRKNHKLVDSILDETVKNIYNGVTTEEVDRALILSASSLIEQDCLYSKIAARLFMQKIRREVFGQSTEEKDTVNHYKDAFAYGIQTGVEKNLLDEKMLDFDLNLLSEALQPERDDLLEYIGIQTLYERYLLKHGEQRLELPQSFWMRVAMGLCFREENKNEKAIEFYEALSSLRLISSTPTLFHSGTKSPQLSSCYLTYVSDDLSHIFKCIGDNAQMSKWSGGLGNDWTSVRGTGAWIDSTKVESQGVIPFLKIANDTTAAINRSGKRRGATCAYLETWHLDIEDFIDLRKNTGDERRRTHDMNTANWIPDLFMKRVKEDKDWTLFSSDETPDLHELYGRAFEKKYVEYEKKIKSGKIKKYKIVSATKLWRKLLTMLFETGHPWITFKDPINVRSPQDHCGVVHSSNLCTEITLNTNEDETAVCNLSSVNLSRHMNKGKLDYDLMAKTVKTAIRMLDNVIDDNFYPVPEARNANFRHRPIGLGLMGLQDVFFEMKLQFDCDEAVAMSNEIMENISYNAILGSSKLAKEKGTYESYKGSKWDRNIFPIDTIKLLEEERGAKAPFECKESLDWSMVREHVKQYGMRNSNTMAIAPTATISNICGAFPCIEPIYSNLYVKSNISGEFTVVNQYLVNDLKKLKLWDQKMLEDIKYYNGNLQSIDRVPQELKYLYKDTFEIAPEWLIKHAAVRGKWIDQSQSLNLYVKGASGKVLNDMYMMAFDWFLKTTYYLRTLGASQVEKSTLDASTYGFTQKRDQAAPVKACRIDNPECESCQ